MAAISGSIALALTAVSAAAGIQQQRKASSAAKRSAREQEKAQQQQRALQHQQRRDEQREQLRMERIRRAQIQQSAENTGTAGSSGSLGAQGSVSSQFGTNMGSLAGMAMHGDAIGAFNQNAANYMSQSNQHMANANMWGQVGSLSSAAFSATGGFEALGKGETQTASNSPVYSGNLNSLNKQKFNPTYIRKL